MPDVAVRETRTLAGADPARVWSLVADLTRLPEWLPVHDAGSMTTEVPTVGQLFFVALRRGGGRKRVLRLRLAEWEAGTRYVCEVSGSSLVSNARFEVTVSGAPSSGPDGTEITLRFRGESSRWAAPLVGAEIRRRFRAALVRLEKVAR